MYKDKVLSIQNLEDFNFEATKKNITDYFNNLEKLNWEWEKLNAQKGLTANYNFEAEYQKQPYITIGKDEFGLSAKEYTEEQIKKHLSSYHWAISIMSDIEKLYIKECFINHKYQDELVDLLGFCNRDDHRFRRLRKSAIYKFADFFNLVVKNEEERA